MKPGSSTPRRIPCAQRLVCSFPAPGSMNTRLSTIFVLHFWLRWTGGNFEYLRIPAILFFLAGLFLLGRAAGRLAGPASATAVIWLGVLWPFGFHYGRLAAWYSFSFFLVAGLTLAYLRYLEDQSPGRWAALFPVWRGTFMDQLFRLGSAGVPGSRPVPPPSRRRAQGTPRCDRGHGGVVHRVLHSSASRVLQ